MVHLLKNVVDQGGRIILATSKPTIIAEKILKYFHINQYFDFIAGSEMDLSRYGKGEVIEYALKKMNINSENATIIATNPVFQGFSSSQTVDKEIISGQHITIQNDLEPLRIFAVGGFLYILQVKCGIISIDMSDIFLDCQVDNTNTILETR